MPVLGIYPRPAYLGAANSNLRAANLGHVILHNEDCEVQLQLREDVETPAKKSSYLARRSRVLVVY